MVLCTGNPSHPANSIIQLPLRYLVHYVFQLETLCLKHISDGSRDCSIIFSILEPGYNPSVRYIRNALFQHAIFPEKPTGSVCQQLLSFTMLL